MTHGGVSEDCLKPWRNVYGWTVVAIWKSGREYDCLARNNGMLFRGKGLKQVKVDKDSRNHGDYACTRPNKEHMQSKARNVSLGRRESLRSCVFSISRRSVDTLPKGRVTHSAAGRTYQGQDHFTGQLTSSTPACRDRTTTFKPSSKAW